MLVLTLAALLAAAGGAPLYADAPAAANAPVILTKGPRPGSGLAWLPPNAISYLSALYESPGASVQVIYVETSIVPASSWPAAACRSLPLRQVPGAEPPVFSYTDPAGWSLFFSSTGGGLTPCDFAALFVPRFTYFLGATQGSAIGSFPAVLQPQ